eukprot:COSAG04_NODE_985_length_8992_cov_18.901844_7_plen_84_part_00
MLAAGSLVADPLWAGLSDRIGRKPLLLVRPVSSLFCRLIQLYGMANPVRPNQPHSLFQKKVSLEWSGRVPVSVHEEKRSCEKG